jgi:MOSC domain-containing protein YiiM
MLGDPADVEVLAVLTGTVRAFRTPDEPSAIAKRAILGAVAVGPLGLAGDSQADLVNHGGADKAIHHYAFDHYPFWRDSLPDHPLLTAPGAFGENISTLGLTEHNVCLGDRFRLGTALVEVSHGRQPCWKLGHRFGRADVAARVVQTGRAGWYYRVLEPGQVTAGDRLALVKRGLTEWTLARLFAVLIGGEGKRDQAALQELTRTEVLAEAWRRRASGLLD